MYSQKVSFDDARLTCGVDGAEIAMPRNVEDISDIKEFDCEYSHLTSPETVKNVVICIQSRKVSYKYCSFC